MRRDPAIRTGPRRWGALILATALGGSVPVVLPGAISKAAASPTYPTSPPAVICGNANLLTGPSSPQAGWMTIPAGDDTSYLSHFTYDTGKTFWFAPGVHTIGTSMYSQILPANNTTYIGAPGAILDGQNLDWFAFTQLATGVTIKYLTIQDFVAPQQYGIVNSNGGHNWTIMYNTITHNFDPSSHNGGGGVVVSPDGIVSYNCLSNNGQYGFTATGADNNFTLDHNEISGNNPFNIDPCGCVGGGKIWSTIGGTITNNWVHDNHGPGIWVDTNDAGILISGNYIDHNYQQAINYEASYNGKITNNNLQYNGIVQGLADQAAGNTYPEATLYLSEAGYDPRVSTGNLSMSTFEISGNNLYDNWGGVQLFEDANRFCSSDGNTSTGLCTLVNPNANLSSCHSAAINNPPLFSDCRWKTQNVSIFNNTFTFNPSDSGVGCTTGACGIQGLFANYGSISPYQGGGVNAAITTAQANRFHNNTYAGTWHFDWGSLLPNDFNQWQGSGISQDAGSTLNGAASPPSLPGNLLDADSSGLEGGVGHWISWVNTSVAQSAAQHVSGNESLQVALTAPSFWGIEMNNWPGFNAAPGPMAVSFWGRARASNTGTPTGATFTANWSDINHNVLATIPATITTLTTGWQQATVHGTAPAGTVYLTVQLTGVSGAPGGGTGDSFYFDQMFIGPTPTTTCPLTANIAGPPAQQQVTVQSSVGLASINSIQITNGTVNVRSFTPGTTNPVVVTATKTNQSQPTVWSFVATDVLAENQACT